MRLPRSRLLALAALPLFIIAANAHHMLAFACRIAVARVARGLPACDVDQLLADLEAERARAAA